MIVNKAECRNKNAECRNIISIYSFLLYTVIFCFFITTIYCEEDTFYLANDELTEIVEPISDWQNDVEILSPYTFYLPKNPVKAGLLSAFIPGAGQIYNEKYLKATGVIAIQGFLVGMTIYSDQKMKEYRDKRYDEEGNIVPEYNMLYRDYYDQRQSYIYWVATSMFLSAMEAFVDAHLMNFNNNKTEIRLKFENQTLQVSISF